MWIKRWRWRIRNRKWRFLLKLNGNVTFYYREISCGTKKIALLFVIELNISFFLIIIFSSGIFCRGKLSTLIIVIRDDIYLSWGHRSIFKIKAKKRKKSIFYFISIYANFCFAWTALNYFFMPLNTHTQIDNQKNFNLIFGGLSISNESRDEEQKLPLR